LAVSPAANRRPLRVLLVDDHMLARFRVRLQLEDIPDLKVVGEATDGFEAVALARTLSPDLVFMDISMPGLDGIEATRRIKSESRGVRVIMLSSHDGEPLHSSAIAAGANGYLVKGADTKSFVTSIQKAFVGQ